MHSTQKFPLVLLSPGAGVPRFLYSGYAQQLASDGFIVATIDYANCGFLADNGKLLDECSNQDTETAFAVVAEDWAAHISEVLDELLGKRAMADPLASEVSRHVDSGRIASMGHSLGGEASMIACDRDARIRACINADGGMGGTRLVETGIHSTALFLRSHPLYSDADLAKRHRTREEFERMGAKFMAETQALFAKPGGDAWVLSISGTGHMSFSDAPYTMPNTISRFGGTIIAPERLFTMVTHLLETYMQHEFNSKTAFRTDEFTEVTVQVSRATSH
jgi:predicted dienelactone hydrolase